MIIKLVFVFFDSDSRPLFALDANEARSDLERFYLVRDHLPDRDMIATLEAKHGLVRDDYPLIPLHFAVNFSVFFKQFF
ncbi:MAG: hypothetical protein PHO08_05695 [Methylococcales bacterium]|nr:hypothetical protein [Methylococcales bacterium]